MNLNWAPKLCESRHFLADEDGEGMLDFMKVEQDIELSPEEYKRLALGRGLKWAYTEPLWVF